MQPEYLGEKAEKLGSLSKFQPIVEVPEDQESSLVFALNRVNRRPWYSKQVVLLGIVLLLVGGSLYFQESSLSLSGTMHFVQNQYTTTVGAVTQPATRDDPQPRPPAKKASDKVRGPSKILKELLQNQHSMCRMEEGTSFDLKKTGHYVNSTEARLLYNHTSCWIMKARYNCAYRPQAPFRMAHHYELVLQLQPFTLNNTRKGDDPARPYCRLRSLIDDVLKEWKLEMTQHEDEDPDDVDGSAPGIGGNNSHTTTRYHVVLQGNSYVRQIFEGLVCGLTSSLRPHLFPHVLVQQGGPGISIHDLQARGDKKVSIAELGNPLTNLTQLQHQGCHGETSSDISAFYRRRAVTPPNLANCNDNVASFQVGNAEEVWKFSYIFKPTLYDPSALEVIYQERFGIHDDSDEDGDPHTHGRHWLVWNAVTKEPQNVVSPLSSAFWRHEEQLSVESWLWALRDLQLRDLGRYFSANNPGIQNPNDFHACMPGTPDDQVHLLLYLLWSGYYRRIVVVEK